MFKGWIAKKWETPISNLKSIAMVSLVDDGSLTIIIEDLRDEKRKRWGFCFESVPVYLNIMGEYRGEMWSEINSSDNKFGWTVKYPNSPWLKKLIESDPMLEDWKPNLKHYQIATEDDVIDILSEKEPIIKEMEPASPDEPIPGKSNIYYRGEDDGDIEKVFEQIEKGHKDS